MRIARMLLMICLLPGFARADDGAASIAAGGIVLMRREPRIVMAKEVLRISSQRVVSDYDFRNDSDQDITTIVAFPVPAYRLGGNETVFGDPAFSDFQLSVDGRETSFGVQARAFVNHREITTELNRSRIDIVSFGRFDEKNPDYSRPVPDYVRRSPVTQKRLTRLGAFENGMPNWEIRKTYFWTQTFPAHATVHIQHRYSPVLGGTNSVEYGLEVKRKAGKKTEDEKATLEEVNSLCVEPSLKASLWKLSRRDDMRVPFNYVDFILTTANTWKTPIEDFTLIVDRPIPEKLLAERLKSRQQNKVLVSFCWNGLIEQPDSTHFVAHATNFVPRKELRIGFVYIDHMDPNWAGN